MEDANVRIAIGCSSKEKYGTRGGTCPICESSEGKGEGEDERQKRKRETRKVESKHPVKRIPSWSLRKKIQVAMT